MILDDKLMPEGLKCKMFEDKISVFGTSTEATQGKELLQVLL
jgi:hypothetical protein